MFWYESSQNSTYLTNFESIALLYFATQCYTADRYIYDLSKTSNTNKKQTLKEGAISGIGR